MVRFCIFSGEGAVGPAREIALKDGYAETEIVIPNAHVWHGRKDPYLYTHRAELLVDGAVADCVETRFGCRSMGFDKDKGFYLNGEPYPLRGVSRHQDRKGVGNAITREMMREDLALIMELGATALRLAHYQHDQYFYDLCDEAGLVVWAEIPYISEHMPEANANTESQMTELVVQNHHHAGIACWGLSNEITAVGGCSDGIIENHKALNALCHRLDNTRPTVTANVFMLDIESALLDVPDIVSYNLYFGWYLGEVQDNDAWFERFRARRPGKVIGLSEYGADASPKFQTAKPERGDYTEQYQCVYHEHMLKLIEKSPYLWATHAWNMFDFAADARDEGGAKGLNQKGLVSFDRKLKKDAYFAYKAHWSDAPFVHLCGRRYVRRAEEITEVKVYSNQPAVALYRDGQLVEEKTGRHVFVFHVPIAGKHVLTAKCGDLADSIQIEKAAGLAAEYLYAGGSVLNWFKEGELQFPKGYLSIKDAVADIKKTPQGAAILAQVMEKMREKRGDLANSVVITEDMQRMMDAAPLEKMLKMGGAALGAAGILALNEALNKIPKAD